MEMVLVYICSSQIFVWIHFAGPKRKSVAECKAIAWGDPASEALNNGEENCWVHLSPIIVQWQLINGGPNKFSSSSVQVDKWQAGQPCEVLQTCCLIYVYSSWRLNWCLKTCLLTIIERCWTLWNLTPFRKCVARPVRSDTIGPLSTERGQWPQGHCTGIAWNVSFIWIWCIYSKHTLWQVLTFCRKWS